MVLIEKFLTNGELPNDQSKAKRIQYLLNRYVILGGKLYKRGYSLPQLRCLDEEKVKCVLTEIHEGICSNYSRADHSWKRH